EARRAAEHQLTEANFAAKQAKADVTKAVAERDAAEEREKRLQGAQKELLGDGPAQPSAERSAAIADLQRQLAAATTEARAARDARAAPQPRMQDADKAGREARQRDQDAIKRSAAVAASLLPLINIPADATPAELARHLQTELKRVGCYVGEVDGTW